MEPAAADPAHQAALDAIKRGFYGGDLPTAVSAAQAVLAGIDPVTCAMGEHAQRARALLWLARCERRADRLDAAMAHALAGVAAARAAGDDRLACQLQAQYVHVLASLGQNETALDAGYQVLRRATEDGDARTQAACWLALGQVHWTMQQWHDGVKAYTEALTRARSCGEKEIEGLACNGIAAMEVNRSIEARAAGRSDEALVHARRALALFQDFTRISVEIGESYNARSGIYNQASCLLAMGEHESASSLLNDQMALLGDEHGSRRQILLQMLGAVHLAQGRCDLAIARQTEALELAERLQLPMLAMDACGMLVDALEASGDYKAALTQYRRYHALHLQLASDRAKSHARAMAVMYETERTLAQAEAQRQRADQLALANSSLVEEKAILQRDSMEDALTGLANRRCFDQALAQARVAEGGSLDVALALIDVDNFKRVNDRYSHLVGDEVLRRLGALLKRHCRRQDVAARYGGEEFALILSRIDRATARAACERLRAAVKAEPWSTLHPELQVTVSIGIVHADEAPAGTELSALLSMADARLYAAKGRGRNRVVGDRHP